MNAGREWTRGCTLRGPTQNSEAYEVWILLLILLLIGDFSNKSMQISNFVKADFCYAISVFQRTTYEISPVSSLVHIYLYSICALGFTRQKSKFAKLEGNDLKMRKKEMKDVHALTMKAE